MKNRSQNVAEKLGMSQGTAANKLRKQLLFHYVTKANQHFCFKCGSEIESVDEFTIEHKAPWLYAGDPIEAFFDLDNIAFSHAACNRPHVYHGGRPKRIESPEGQSWCSGCKTHLPISEFHKNSSRYDGLQRTCKSCHSVLK